MEKRARRHAKNTETTQQKSSRKSNSFQAQTASKMQKGPPRQILLFRQKLSFLQSNLKATPILECKKTLHLRGHANSQKSTKKTQSRVRQKGYE